MKRVEFSTQTLTTLDLSENGIGDEGAQHLADGLRKNKVSMIGFRCVSYKRVEISTQTLMALYLQVNKIGEEGAQRLADVLRTNTVSSIVC